MPDEDHRELLEVSPAPLLVAARAKEESFVVIDLDHTVVDSSFFRVLTFGAKPMADSVAVTNRIVQLYNIIYLTHRPDLMTRKSKLVILVRADVGFQDPEGWTRDATSRGLGMERIFDLADTEELEYAMSLIGQSYRLVSERAG